jgi:1-acyl-sn-glycerol-3-phosphate acyltransferase
MKGERNFLRYWVYYLARFFVWLFLKVWERYECFGAENVPDSGGCIVASNHVSFLDPPAVGAGVGNRLVHFLARDTLFRGWLRNWFFTAVKCVPIDRTKGDVGALRKSLQILKEGKLLALFPEGTRSPNGELQPAKGGVGFLISKAGVPVVPAYVDGSFEAFPKGAKKIKRGHVRIFFGMPIRPDEIGALGTTRESYEEIGRLVMSRIAELRDRARATKSR